jgi:ABC-type uncharacterized transport system substrate-binding protein
MLQWRARSAVSLSAIALSSAMSSAALLGTTTAVHAHPHVYIEVALEIVIEGGVLKAIKHVWTFDDFYSASAVDGLDTNKDGIYTREELAELTKTNVEGLKEFNYFTFPTLAGAEQKVADPVLAESYHAFKDGKLTLHFTVPLAQPILAEAKGIELTVHDPSFFIAFEIKDDKRVTLSATAPKDCTLAVGKPKSDGSDQSRLNESFFSALGGGNFGITFAKPITITCGKG